MHKILSILVGISLAISELGASEIDVYEKSNIHPDVLSEILLYELSEHAYAFVDAEIESEINAVALASIAAVESDWGRSQLAIEKNNLFGWKDNSGNYMEFYSYDECILYVGSRIKDLYLKESSPYYNDGTCLSDISSIYSESENWANTVSDVYNGIINRITELNVENVNGDIKQVGLMSVENNI